MSGFAPEQITYSRTMKLRFATRFYCIGHHQISREVLQQAWQGSDGSEKWVDVELTDIVVK